MANHPSAIKRARSSAAQRLSNRYQLKTCKTFLKKLKGMGVRQQAEALLPEAYSMLDKLAKKRIIHPNKAAHSKSQLAVWVHKLSA